MMPSRKHNSQYWMPSIFNDFFDDAEWPVTRRRNSVPAINIIESDKGYKVEVAAPGLKKEDFNIHLTGSAPRIFLFQIPAVFHLAG